MTSSNPEPNHRNAGSTPDDAGNGTKQKIKDDARDVKREASSQAREKVDLGKHRIADEADNLSDAIDAAASSLDDHDREGLARYARQLSSNLANAAGQLEGRTVDELANDAKRLARNNPALFMLGSVAVGFGLSRFFKASAKHDHHDDAQRADANQNNAQFGNDDASIGASAPRRERDTTDTYESPTAQRSGNGSEML